MKIAKRVGIALAIYIGIIIAFESMIGIFQPDGETTLVITTSEAGGQSNDRVLARLESGGKLYVAANHWPRAWYNRALENPNVEVIIDSQSGEREHYVAVPVVSPEHEQVDEDHSLPFVFRVLTGFPPRYFLRLDPV